MVLKILEFLNSLFVKLWTSFLAMRTSFDIICICKIFLLVSRHDVTSSTCTSLCETLSSFSWMNNANDMNLLFLSISPCFCEQLVCNLQIKCCDLWPALSDGSFRSLWLVRYHSSLALIGCYWHTAHPCPWPLTSVHNSHKQNHLICPSCRPPANDVVSRFPQEAEIWFRGLNEG